MPQQKSGMSESVSNCLTFKLALRTGLVSDSGFGTPSTSQRRLRPQPCGSAAEATLHVGTQQQLHRDHGQRSNYHCRKGCWHFSALSASSCFVAPSAFQLMLFLRMGAFAVVLIPLNRYFIPPLLAVGPGRQVHFSQRIPLHPSNPPAPLNASSAHPSTPSPLHPSTPRPPPPTPPFHPPPPPPALHPDGGGVGWRG